MQDTWRAVRHAPGFGLGFVAWWAEQQLAPQCSQGLPLSCPPSDILAVMFDSFNGFVRKYEAQLAHSRYSFAKRRRESSLNFVFQDCRADPLPQADTLIDRVEAGVEEVREDEQSVVLTTPIQLIPGVPVVAQGTRSCKFCIMRQISSGLKMSQVCSRAWLLPKSKQC
jgi:hypothetical protein